MMSVVPSKMMSVLQNFLLVDLSMLRDNHASCSPLDGSTVKKSTKNCDFISPLFLLVSPNSESSTNHVVMHPTSSIFYKIFLMG